VQRHLPFAWTESSFIMGRKNGSKTPPSEPDVASENGGKGWMIRREVAKRLGMAENSVKRRDGIDFHPDQQGGRFFYDPAEVERYAEQHGAKRASAASGQIAARAFRMFEAGKGFRDVVMELEVTPAQARRAVSGVRPWLGPLCACRNLPRDRSAWPRRAAGSSVDRPKPPTAFLRAAPRQPEHGETLDG
jgi:hypothetical protein